MSCCQVKGWLEGLCVCMCMCVYSPVLVVASALTVAIFINKQKKFQYPEKMLLNIISYVHPSQFGKICLGKILPTWTKLALAKLKLSSVIVLKLFYSSLCILCTSYRMGASAIWVLFFRVLIIARARSASAIKKRGKIKLILH